MGWDSDSDDAVDIDAQLAAKKAAQKSEFEEETKVLKAIEKQKQPEKPVAKPQAPVVASSTVEIVTTRTYDEDEIAQADPRLEKERMKRLQEKSEMAIMGDLFAGCEPQASGAGEFGPSSLVREVVKTIKEDSFEKLKLATTRDVELLASRCSDKVLSSEVKSVSHKFLHEVIRSVGHSLSVTDVNALSKTLKELSVAKAREQAEKMAGKKKLSTDVAQMKKGAKIDVFDAIDEVYGDNYEGDDYEEGY